MLETSPYIPGFIAAYSILLIGSLSPGPSVALLVGVATSQGRIPALTATLGIAFGSVTLNILTILGVGFILSQAAWAMTLLRMLGTAYLLYLAYGAFKKAMNPPSMQISDAYNQAPLKNLLAGYLLQVTNPKAVAFWLAIASVGAVEGAGFAVILLFLIGGFIISFTCHGVWAVALSTRSIRLTYFQGRRWVERVLGCFFSFAAYKLATSEA